MDRTRTSTMAIAAFLGLVGLVAPAQAEVFRGSRPVRCDSGAYVGPATGGGSDHVPGVTGSTARGSAYRGSQVPTSNRGIFEIWRGC